MSVKFSSVETTFIAENEEDADALRELFARESVEDVSFSVRGNTFYAVFSDYGALTRINGALGAYNLEWDVPSAERAVA